MGKVFHTTRRVEFSETDVAGIAHFSSLLLYVEQTEHAFWRSAGFSVFQMHVDGEESTLSWPRVRVECDFLSAVTFEDLLDLELIVERLGTKSVTYRVTMECEGRRVAVAKMTACCCEMSHGSVQARAIPESICKLLREYQ